MHTSQVRDSRIKMRNTHKAFWHIKKTAKQEDDPVTPDNRDFIQQMIRANFVDKMPLELAEQKRSGESKLKEDLQPWPRGQWPGPWCTRSGLIGRKIGVIPMWTKKGKRVMATMIHIEDVHVVKYIPAEEYAQTYGAQKRLRPTIWYRNKSVSRGVLVVGALSADPQTMTRDYCGLFTASGLAPKKKLARFPVSPEAVIQPGTRLRASHFQAGQYVDIIGRGMRRGFQGVMKRWGFAGMPSGKYRGVTKSHRRPGAIGSGREKSRVWPGQKLPGHVGGNRSKHLGLKILRVDNEHDIIYVKGQAVPGWPGEFVQLFDAKGNEK